MYKIVFQVYIDKVCIRSLSLLFNYVGTHPHFFILRASGKRVWRPLRKPCGRLPKPSISTCLCLLMTDVCVSMHNATVRDLAELKLIFKSQMGRSVAGVMVRFQVWPCLDSIKMPSTVYSGYSL